MFTFINNTEYRLIRKFILFFIVLINLFMFYDFIKLNANQSNDNFSLDETFIDKDSKINNINNNDSKVENKVVNIQLNNLEIFNKIIKKARDEKWHFLTNQERIITLAKYFIGTKYIAGTLENPKNESADLCILNLTGLDCFTFVELVINLNNNIALKKYTYDELIKSIFDSRYKANSNIENLLYTDRLHYTSEWLLENSKRNLFVDISKLLGGEKIKFNLGFMSQNPKYYPVLMNNQNLIEEIVNSENKVNNSEFYYIHKSKVAKIEGKLLNGDIILISTNKVGLDYSHLGFAYIDEKGITRLMHASSKKKEVIIDNKLSEYLNSNNSTTGITVLRIK